MLKDWNKDKGSAFSFFHELVVQISLLIIMAQSCHHVQVFNHNLPSMNNYFSNSFVFYK